jgi:hypothetical protein
MDEGRTDQLVFFAFDLLFLNGESTAHLPLIERKERLKRLFKNEVAGLRYSEHVIGDGPRFREHACQLGLESAISKRADRPTPPVTAGSGSNPSASTGRSSSSSAGPILREAGRTSARCCSATTRTTAACTTPAVQAPA